MSVKFPFFGGVFLGGGGVPILFLWARGFFWLNPRNSHPTLRTHILKFFILAWTLEIFKLFAWKFHSRLKTSFSLENFNLDLENSPQLEPLLCGSLENFILDWRFHSRLKVSIPDENLENFLSLGPGHWEIKGRFPKGWFWRMFPRNENRNEGTFAKTTLLETALLSPNDPFWCWQKGGFQKGGFGGCSPGTKTGTRVRSPKPPFYETALLSPSFDWIHVTHIQWIPNTIAKPLFGIPSLPRTRSCRLSRGAVTAKRFTEG